MGHYTVLNTASTFLSIQYSTLSSCSCCYLLIFKQYTNFSREGPCFSLSFLLGQPTISRKSSTELIYTLYCALILTSRQIITFAGHMWVWLWSCLARGMLAYVSMRCNWGTVSVGQWGYSDHHSFRAGPTARVLGIFVGSVFLEEEVPNFGGSL